MRALILPALALSCVISQAVVAQCRRCLPATILAWDGSPEPLGELPPIATDRPDFTEASSTVGLGVVQLEMGYTFAKSTGAEAHSWGEPLLRFGMFTNWLELRIAASPISERSVVTQSGTEDLYLGTKLGLTQQDGWLPEMAVVPQMTVPTGSSAFTANQVLPGVNLLYGWDVTENLSFAGSTRYNTTVDDVGSDYSEWAQSLTVGRSLSEKVGSYFEWFALFPADHPAVLAEHYINGGFIYGLNDDVQFDIRIGKGLSDSADDYFVGAGLALRLW